MIHESFDAEGSSVDLTGAFPADTDDVKLIDMRLSRSHHGHARGNRSNHNSSGNNNSRHSGGGEDAGGALERHSSGDLPSGFVFEQRSTTAGATFNFVNSIVGAGIIGIPYAFYRCGFFLAIILLLIVACLVNQSIMYLVSCGLKTRKLDYEALCEHVLGKAGFYFATAAMWMFSYGAMIAYLIILGDVAPKLFELIDHDNPLAERHAAIALVAVVLILPCCLMKEMSTLSAVSAVSIIVDFSMVLIVLIDGPEEAKEQDIQASDYKHAFAFARPTLFAGLGTISFAFICQHSSFMIYRSLQNPTLARWRRVTNLSVAASCILCLTLGLGGYLSFFNKTEGDVLNNFKDHGVAIDIARAMLTFSMVSTFPMEQFVARHCIMKLFGRGTEFNLLWHVVVTLLLWGSAVLIALVTHDLGVVLEVTGSLAGSLLGYILPASVMLKLHEKQLRQAIDMWKAKSPTYTPALSQRLKALGPFVVPTLMWLVGVVALTAGFSQAVMSASS